MGNKSSGFVGSGGGGGGVRGRTRVSHPGYEGGGGGPMSYDCQAVAVKGPLFASAFPQGISRDEAVEIRVSTEQNTLDIMPPAMEAPKGGAKGSKASKKNQDSEQISVSYADITHLGWDHGNCEAKITIKSEEGTPETASFIVFTLENSIDFETDMKNRCNYISSKTKGFKYPLLNYVGMFAGSQKPKPFQRKRPNLSAIPAGKMPPLDTMRSTAERLHHGSYTPCPPGESRRLDYAIQHIFEGCNYFHVVNIKGWVEIAKLWSYDSLLKIDDRGIVLLPKGVSDKRPFEFLFEDVDKWICHDKDNIKASDSTIEVFSRPDENGESQSVSFAFTYIRDVKHTLEYFWNKFQLANQGIVKAGSTHGRPIVSCSSLSGVIAALPPPEGSCEVVDANNMPIRGGKRRSSYSKDDKPLIENPVVREHWERVVVHQGWLSKKGGLGIGAAKNWIKRYFVLFKTSQGHFLTYYADVGECPFYSQERQQRNLIDIAKVTFIRPGSSLSTYDDTPPHCFDIITTEREWTLCAESKENHLRWLQIISRAVDEDVAIVPDENLVFNVKAKVDPTGYFCPNDYSTCLKVSSQGVEVSIINPSDGREDKKFFWIYTDFFKWQLYSQRGKIAVLLNVFTDKTYKKRHEFIFRTKDAIRMASAIEYFIEKFMSTMHMRLELSEEEGGLAPPDSLSGGGGGSNDSGINSSSAGGGHATGRDRATTQNTSDMNSGGMHEVDQQEFVSNVSEADLLNFDDDDNGGNNNTYHKGGRSGSMPDVPAPPVPKKTANLLELDDDDDGDEVEDANVDDLIDLPVAVSVNNMKQGGGGGMQSGHSSDHNLLDDDYLDSMPAVPPPPPPPSAKGGKKMAAPLSPNQLANHSNMYVNACTSGSGPIYDDGFVKISVKVDIRQSQGRLGFQIQNISKYGIADLKLSIDDPSNFIRYEFMFEKRSSSELTLKLDSRQTDTFSLMVECIAPVHSGAKLLISYTSLELGFFATTVNLPLIVASFNEEVRVAGSKFAPKWEASRNTCTEAKAVIKLSRAADPEKILHIFTRGLKFNKIDNVPGESDTVFYGASTLRTGELDDNDVRISIGHMAKVEVNLNKNAVRVSVRSLHPTSSAAMVEAFRSLLEPQSMTDLN